MKLRYQNAGNHLQASPLQCFLVKKKRTQKTYTMRVYVPCTSNFVNKIRTQQKDRKRLFRRPVPGKKNSEIESESLVAIQIWFNLTRFRKRFLCVQGNRTKKPRGQKPP